MSLCEVLVLADEHDGGNPKLLGLVLPEAVANNLRLTDVPLWRARTRIRTSQDVDSRLVEFFAQKQLVNFCSRRCYRLAGPVGDFGCPETLRVSPGQELFNRG